MQLDDRIRPDIQLEYALVSMRRPSCNHRRSFTISRHGASHKVRGAGRQSQRWWKASACCGGGNAENAGTVSILFINFAERGLARVTVRSHVNIETITTVKFGANPVPAGRVSPQNVLKKFSGFLYNRADHENPRDTEQAYGLAKSCQASRLSLQLGQLL
jgi:hypothetical protein